MSLDAQAAIVADLRKTVAATISQAELHAGPALTLEDARSLARRRNRALIYLSPTWAPHELHVSATILRWPGSFWQKARVPEGHLKHRDEARVRYDALLLKYLPAKSITHLKSLAYTLPVSQPVAIACDVLVDSLLPTLVVVGRTELAVEELSGTILKHVSKRPWSDLTAIASTPLRAPLASVVVGTHAIEVGSSDRADRLSLDKHLKVIRKESRGYPFKDGSCSAFSSRGIHSPSADCQQTASPEWDSYARASFVELDGSLSEYVAKIGLGRSELVVTVSGPRWGMRTFTIKDAAGPIALGDIEGDGTVNLITTSSDDSDSDKLKVFALELDGPRAVTEWASAEIRAVSLCPFDGINPRVIVVATDGALTLLTP